MNCNFAIDRRAVDSFENVRGEPGALGGGKAALSPAELEARDSNFGYTAAFDYSDSHYMEDWSMPHTRRPSKFSFAASATQSPSPPEPPWSPRLPAAGQWPRGTAAEAGPWLTGQGLGRWCPGSQSCAGAVDRVRDPEAIRHLRVNPRRKGGGRRRVSQQEGRHPAPSLLVTASKAQ